MKIMKALFSKYKFLFLVLGISFFAIRALLHPSLFPSHDGEYHVIRFYEFDKMLRSGAWYPRWAPDLAFGFGVPLFTYVYPFPNYVASLFHLFGFSFIDAFRLNLLCAMLIGAIFFYQWAKLFWGQWGGLLSTILYTFSPYHFVDVYIRGSVGEVWALAWSPAFLWSVTYFTREKKRKYLIFSSLFLACIIFSHNILALQFFSFAIFYCFFLFLIEKEKKRVGMSLLLIIIFGLGLSAIFWVPALWEKQYVVGLQIYNIYENFPEVFQLLIPSWGSGFSGSGLENQMSFQIGIVNLLVVLLSIGALFISWKKKSQRYILLFFLAWFVIVFFFMLRSSLWFWEHIPLINYFQFPWRLLSLEILIASFLGGSVTVYPRSKIFIIILIILIVVTTIGYAQPAYYFNRDDHYYISRSNFIDSTNSPGDEFNTLWAVKQTKRAHEKIQPQSGLAIKNMDVSPSQYSFTTSTLSSKIIAVNTQYFPGWDVSIDNKAVTVRPTKQGLLMFTLPKGRHQVKINFEMTTEQKIATGISLVFLLSLLLVYKRFPTYECRN